MATKQKTGITAIIVTYHPNTQHLNKVILRIFDDVDFIVVVDNHSPRISQWKMPLKFRDKVRIIKLTDNFGIAYSQNLGADWAIQNQANYILFLDQDSLPKKNMIYELVKCFDIVNINKNNRILVLGPTIVDPITKIQTKFLIDNKEKKLLKLNENVVLVSSLISSGLLVNTNAFKAIGGMQNNYFIDHVDTEWVHRLINKGYQAIGAKEAILYHRVGERIIKHSFMGYKISFVSHEPLRNYYKIRNSFFMAIDLKLNLKNKVGIYFGIFKNIFSFLLFDDRQAERFKYIFYGFLHGLMNVRGKLDTKSMKCNKISTTKFNFF